MGCSAHDTNTGRHTTCTMVHHKRAPRGCPWPHAPSLNHLTAVWYAGVSSTREADAEAAQAISSTATAARCSNGQPVALEPARGTGCDPQRPAPGRPALVRWRTRRALRTPARASVDVATAPPCSAMMLLQLRYCGATSAPHAQPDRASGWAPRAPGLLAGRHRPPPLPVPDTPARRPPAVMSRHSAARGCVSGQRYTHHCAGATVSWGGLVKWEWGAQSGTVQ